jgi:hypothetical protein
LRGVKDTRHDVRSELRRRGLLKRKRQRECKPKKKHGKRDAKRDEQQRRQKKRGLPLRLKLAAFVTRSDESGTKPRKKQSV